MKARALAEAVRTTGWGWAPVVGGVLVVVGRFVVDVVVLVVVVLEVFGCAMAITGEIGDPEGAIEAKPEGALLFG